MQCVLLLSLSLEFYSLPSITSWQRPQNIQLPRVSSEPEVDREEFRKCEGRFPELVRVTVVLDVLGRPAVDPSAMKKKMKISQRRNEKCSIPPCVDLVPLMDARVPRTPLTPPLIAILSFLSLSIRSLASRSAFSFSSLWLRSSSRCAAIARSSASRIAFASFSSRSRSNVPSSYT